MASFDHQDDSDTISLLHIDTDTTIAECMVSRIQARKFQAYISMFSFHPLEHQEHTKKHAPM